PSAVTRAQGRDTAGHLPPSVSSVSRKNGRSPAIFFHFFFRSYRQVFSLSAGIWNAALAANVSMPRAARALTQWARAYRPISPCSPYTIAVSVTIYSPLSFCLGLLLALASRRGSLAHRRIDLRLIL